MSNSNETKKNETKTDGWIGRLPANDESIEGLLLSLLDEDGDLTPADLGVESVETLEDAGVFTKNRGLVVRLRNGREFQVTVVRSR